MTAVLCDMKIVGGNHRADKTVGMGHGQEYAVRLVNQSSRRMDVRLSIDGELLDVFRLHAYSSATIETKPNSGKKLTFYKLHTVEAVTGAIADNEATGLVTAVFTPEVAAPPPVRVFDSQLISKGATRSAHFGAVPVAMGLDSAGGTALSGHSSQQFVNAEQMILDHAASVTIHLRLVCQSSSGIQPLHLTVPPRPAY